MLHLTEYDSKRYYLIEWDYDEERVVTNGWSLNAIKHQELKEGCLLVHVIREATKEDIVKYGIS